MRSDMAGLIREAMQDWSTTFRLCLVLLVVAATGPLAFLALSMVMRWRLPLASRAVLLGFGTGCAVAAQAVTA
ncbi:hypothetical protein ABZ446_46345 [Streptomyces sp. NPDC005813]|uniref:hypothetical protein n=1 Tax=Streptomyces sp. NPDC005813 TaxID=3155592 RepID=UPI0033CB320C